MRCIVVKKMMTLFDDDDDVLVMVNDGDDVDDDLVVDVPLQHRMTLAEHHQRTHLVYIVINLDRGDADDYYYRH